MKSWKTTLTGALQLLIVLANEGVSLADSDPLTNPNWSLVITSIIIFVGLVKARDNDVSSENAGAK